MVNCCLSILEKEKKNFSECKSAVKSEHPNLPQESGTENPGLGPVKNNQTISEYSNQKDLIYQETDSVCSSAANYPKIKDPCSFSTQEQSVLGTELPADDYFRFDLPKYCYFDLSEGIWNLLCKEKRTLF